MTTSTTNRFLSKTLLTLCCVGALIACPAWATVVSWQINAGGTLSTPESLKAGLNATSQATEGAPQYSFTSASQASSASESSSLADSLNKTSSAGETSTASKQADNAALFASADAPSRPSTELDEAMARNFGEDFVSVPSIQFATTAPGAQNVAARAMDTMTGGPGPMPVPEMSALFPIVGLLVAISCTQILRRRRVAQQTAPR